MNECKLADDGETTRNYYRKCLFNKKEEIKCVHIEEKGIVVELLPCD